MAKKSLLEFAEFKFSVTDMIWQVVLGLIVATSGYWQSVPIAYLIPAILLTILAVAGIMQIYRTEKTKEPDVSHCLPLPGQATLPRATAEELSQRTVSHRAFFIADVPRDDVFWMQIRGRKFKHCEIFGPAIIAPGPMCTLKAVGIGIQAGIPVENAYLRSHPDAPIWGTIQLEACDLEDCELIGIAIAGDDGFIEQTKNMPDRRPPHERGPEIQTHSPPPEKPTE